MNRRKIELSYKRNCNEISNNNLCSKNYVEETNGREGGGVCLFSQMLVGWGSILRLHSSGLLSQWTDEWFPRATCPPTPPGPVVITLLHVRGVLLVLPLGGGAGPAGPGWGEAVRVRQEAQTIDHR